jgi:uracil-DNA glycosylase family 4
MSATPERAAAFLAEMGVGPLWRLRAPAPTDDACAQVSHAEDVAGPVAACALAATAAQPLSAAPALLVVDAAPPVEDDTAAPALRAATSAWDATPPAPAAGASTGDPVAPVAMADSAWDAPEPVAPASDDDIARMDWNQLQAAVASCSRCALSQGGRAPVAGGGARTALWLVAAGASTAADHAERRALAGDPGKLLTNMLAAAGLVRDEQVYVTNLIKCRPTSANGGDRAPSAEEARACRPYLERELALCGAGTVLTLGQIAANALLGAPLPTPLAGTRGSIHRFNGVPLVATLHPGELLRRGADKALAWADLCLAGPADVERA